MKKIEIKKMGALSTFKTVIYITCLPIGLMALFGLIASVFSAVVGDGSIMAFALPFVIMPFIMLGLYGLISMLVALIYNMFAGKFGGLELVIVEANEPDYKI